MPQITSLQRGELATTGHAPGTADFYELKKFWQVLQRRRVLFACVVAGFVAIVAVISILTPKSYTTTVRLMAGNPQEDTRDPNTALPILNALVVQNGQETAETFATLAQEYGVASEVVQRLKLNVPPADLLKRVNVKPVVNTPILDLSVTWRDPQTSAKVANAFGDAFIDRERGFVQSQAVAALGFLSSELPQAQERMRTTAAQLASYQAANGFVDAGTHTQDVVKQAAAIDAKIEATTLDSREAGALLSNARQQLASLPATVNAARQTSVNPILADLRSKLETTDVQLQQARQQYTDAHPLVTNLKKQHDALLKQIAQQPAEINSQNTLSPNPVYQTLQEQASQYQQRMDGDQAELALLHRQREKIAPVLQSLPQKSLQLANLQQQAKLASDLYAALEQKYSDAYIARSTALSDISVVQAATADTAVKRPNLKINVLAALIVGLLLASIAILILDAIEHRIRSGIADARVLGLPLIARIPAFAPVSRSMLPWVQSMTIEAFLHLCVSLRLKTKPQLRTLSVSSPCRGDGKSTVAFNLAKAMATLEPRVLLVDADMRVPTLHEQAGCPNEEGLSEVLNGKRAFADCVKQIAPNLDLLTAGAGTHNPVSLLQAATFDDMLQSAAQQYRMIIVDTPALASVTDALLVTARTDGTVIVVAENRTDEDAARRIIAEFSAIGLKNVLGIVLNMDTARVSDYSDYFARSVHPQALPGAAQ
jgi:capsular exopolysaccharide synthesis family protein